MKPSAKRTFADLYPTPSFSYTSIPLTPTWLRWIYKITLEQEYLIYPVFLACFFLWVSRSKHKCANSCRFRKLRFIGKLHFQCHYVCTIFYLLLSSYQTWRYFSHLPENATRYRCDESWGKTLVKGMLLILRIIDNKIMSIIGMRGKELKHFLVHISVV